jgi:hypothetical protein
MSLLRIHPATTASWSELLSRAGCADEVLTTARDFLARFSPEEVAQLPQECRPAKLVDETDVTDYAFLLASDACTAIDAVGVHARLSAFFAAASARIGELSAAARRESA